MANVMIADSGRTDNVNHPGWYCDGGIETIDFIEAKQLGYHLGNAVKYISRAGKKNKETEIEDLEKAVFYINRKIEILRSREEPKTNESAMFNYKNMSTSEYPMLR